MGTTSSSPIPNVRENHSRALYINIPISIELIKHLILPPCLPDLYNNVTYISIVIDDLDKMEIYFNNNFYNSYLSGWMCKLNLLVKCNLPNTDEEVKGYQICTLDFENNWGGYIKVIGARNTQYIPTWYTKILSSFGTTGKSMESKLDNNTSFYTDMSIDNKEILNITGTISTNVSYEMKEFMDYVVKRPYKFLAQNGDKLAYSPETGVGSELTSDSSVLIDVLTLSTTILERIGIDSKDVDLSKAIVFVQPNYIIVDHHNISID